MELEEYMKKVEKASEIENLFEEILGKKRFEDLIQLMWNKIKDDYEEEPDMDEISYRIMVEEITVYMVAIKGKELLDKILNLFTQKKAYIKIKSYEEIETYYKKYVDIIREHLKEHNNENNSKKE